MLLKASFLELGRREEHRSLFLLILHLVHTTTPEADSLVRDLAASRSEHAELHPEAAYAFRKLFIKAEDAPSPIRPPERRPKQVNGNYRPVGCQRDLTESADPTRPIPIMGPEGRVVYRWDASGEDGFEANSLDCILRGGDMNRRRIKMAIYYPDGRTTTGGCYHRGSHVWDKLVVKWRIEDFRDYRFAEDDARAYESLHQEISFAPPAADGSRRAYDIYGNAVDYVMTGFAGMMEQPYSLDGAAALGITTRRPMIEDYNYTRSRHGFTITLEEGREIWRSRGSLSHNRPKATLNPGREGEWVNENHQHGYGGRPLMNEDGYVVFHDGTPWMIYERVTEMNEWRCEQGLRHTLPWKTEVVARRMKTPYEFFRKGERTWHGKDGSQEILIASVNNPQGVPFPATDRHGMGYLFEGFNVASEPVQIGHHSYWIGTGSPGNYVEDYGVILGYRREEEGPIGRYTLATGPDGDLENSARDFAANYGLTWTGRADIFFDTAMQPWVIMHAVCKDTLPAGFPLTGWPKASEFEYYFRNQYIVPVEFVEVNGRPSLRFLDPFAAGAAGVRRPMVAEGEAARA
jgi:hypothetical protein